MTEESTKTKPFDPFLKAKWDVRCGPLGRLTIKKSACPDQKSAVESFAKTHKIEIVERNGRFWGEWVDRTSQVKHLHPFMCQDMEAAGQPNLPVDVVQIVPE